MVHQSRQLFGAVVRSTARQPNHHRLLCEHERFCASNVRSMFGRSSRVQRRELTGPRWRSDREQLAALQYLRQVPVLFRVPAVRHRWCRE